MPTSKKARIADETERLMKLFDSIADNKLDFLQHQIATLAWLNVTTADLKQSIDKAGTSIGYDNGGGQTGVRVNPDIKTLTDFMKQQNAICKQLVDVLPYEPDKKAAARYSSLCRVETEEEREARLQRQREEQEARQRRIDEEIDRAAARQKEQREREAAKKAEMFC